MFNRDLCTAAILEATKECERSKKPCGVFGKRCFGCLIALTVAPETKWNMHLLAFQLYAMRFIEISVVPRTSNFLLATWELPSS